MPVEEYEDRARRAIEKAIREAGDGRSANAFAKRLRDRVGNGPGLSAPSRWVRSGHGHERVPAWALLAAAEVAGVGVAELLEEHPLDLHAEIDAIKAELDELREAVAAIQRNLPTADQNGEPLLLEWLEQQVEAAVERAQRRATHNAAN